MGCCHADVSGRESHADGALFSADRNGMKSEEVKRKFPFLPIAHRRLVLLSM